MTWNIFLANRSPSGIIFQLTSSRRGWRFMNHICMQRSIFQLTSSRRGWRTVYFRNVIYFNSHPHEEDDQMEGPGKTAVHNETISTHILTKRMTALCSSPESQTHFNSHPHEEDDLYLVCCWRSLADISTHILTKRMTVRSTSGGSPPVISTHILTKRMTYIWIFKATILFQLTSSRRGWTNEWVRNTAFQLTSSRRGWPYQFPVTLFQLTSSRRGWPTLFSNFLNPLGT